MVWYNRLIKKHVSNSPVVEHTPVVWKGRLLLVETWQSHWDKQGGKHPGKYYVRIRDEETNAVIARCMDDFGFSSAFVWNERLYVFATRMPTAFTDKYPSQSVYMSSTQNLTDWTEPVLAVEPDKDEQLFNQSVCHDGRRFVMAYESSTYVPFTLKFAQSDDLMHWHKIPDALYGPDKYAACPALRFANGYYYMLYLEHRRPKWWFETFLTRSKDLIHWQDAPHNPVIAPDSGHSVHAWCNKHGDPAKSRDYYGYGSEPTSIAHDREENCPALGRECNASDPDLVEWQGKTRVYFTGGCQHWGGLLQYAEFDGPMAAMFEHYYEQEQKMTPRERVLTTFRRSKADRVPYDIGFFNREALRRFTETTGSADPDAYFGVEKDIALVDFKPTRLDLKERFLKYHDIDADTQVSSYDMAGYGEGEEIKTGQFHLNELGTGFKVGSNTAYDYFIAPAKMTRTTELADMESYPLPDAAEPYRHEHLDAEVAAIHGRGLAAVCSMEMTVFESAWQIRGLDELLMDFLVNEDMAACLLDRITALSCFRASRFAGAGVDVIRMGDDVGMEDRMIISPATWRKWLKPRLAKAVSAAKNVKRDVLISYHSDGYVEPIIDELIEIGIDILNPVQPECMDPAKIKKIYGKKLAFWGAISIQKTLPFGTPAAVKAEVIERLRTIGQGGGYYLSPSHMIAPEVPYENIQALVDAVKADG